MNYTGIWNAGKILADDGFITVDEFNALPDEGKDDLFVYLSKSFLDFKDDGTMQIYFVLPEDEVDSAREEGFEIIDGNHALLNTFIWKEENGVVYYSCESFGIDNMPTEFSDDGGMIIAGTIIYYKQ